MDDSDPPVTATGSSPVVRELILARVSLSKLGVSVVSDVKKVKLEDRGFGESARGTEAQTKKLHHAEGFDDSEFMDVFFLSVQKNCRISLFKLCKKSSRRWKFRSHAAVHLHSSIQYIPLQWRLPLCSSNVYADTRQQWFLLSRGSPTELYIQL
jgi:hypothetical protein